MLVKKDLFLFLCNKRYLLQRVLNFVLTASLLMQPVAYAASNSASKDILAPNGTAFDFTFTDDTNSSIYLNKTYIEVSQVVKEIEKIANALVPRDISVENCSLSGCPIDAVQCDAVTESPSCPDGSILNTVRDMCQKEPDVFDCPNGFTYDNDIRQCVKPLDCPNGGTYSIERNRCEFKRIYECPIGYTQDGDTCIAPPTCPSGATFDSTLLKCTTEPTFACADTGWTYDPSTNKCFYDPPTCPMGMTYSKTYDKCLLAYTPTCATGYTYNSTKARCEKAPPDCPSGTTYNATTNRCEQGAGSACTLSGGTWNGTDCTVDSSYPAATSTSSCKVRSPIRYSGTMSFQVNPYYEYTINVGSTTTVSRDGHCAGEPVVATCNSDNTVTIVKQHIFIPSETTILTIGNSVPNYFNSNPSDCRGPVNAFITFASSNTTYTCPSGGTLSGTTCINQTTVAPSCPSGYTHDGTGKCYANPTCPLSGSFDGANDVCWLSFSKSCTSGTYDATSNQCVSNPICSKGVFNSLLDRCEQDYVPVCNTGWTFNATIQMCEKLPFCIVGSYSSTYDKCLLAYTPTCATGYIYNSIRNRCEKTPPDCPSGTTYNATTNRCEQGANSACAIAGGTWNGSSCTVGSNYAAIVTQTVTQCYYGAWGNNGASFMYDEYVLVGQNSTKTGAYCRNDGALVNGGSVLLPGASTSGGGGIIIRNLTTPTTTYTCPSGGTLSGTTCINQTTVAPSCPSGYTHDGTGKCYANPTCPLSGSFDGANDVCWLSFSKSCTSGTYDSTSNACINEPICDGGTLNTILDKCHMSREIICSQGVKDPVSGKCTFTATCQSGATLDVKGCNEEPIPLTCPSGTDTVLNVCYSNQDTCKVATTYPKYATLSYSDALNICIIDENIICASSLTWSELYKKCEAVPICYNGMYNPENDFCYISTKTCPTNAAYPCLGPIGNQWCSPYNCNPSTNQCGYAECPGAIQPSQTAEMSPSYNANLIYNASDTLCTNGRCDLANSSRFTYCGLEEACPSGFGVFEQNGQCFVRECPQGSFQENSKCYSLGCPQGTTVQGDGKCLVN